MEFSVDHTIEVLERTPKVLRAMLAGLSDDWAAANCGKETFSPYDVVGHLIHGERADWIPRARIIIDHGESRPFDPFDRFAQYEESRGRTLEELLGIFESFRAGNIIALEALPLTPENLQRRGSHPALGTVTLAELLATWAVHDLNHIAQIARTMGFQYRDAVGPWAAYISILPAK